MITWKEGIIDVERFLFLITNSENEYYFKVDILEFEHPIELDQIMKILEIINKRLLESGHMESNPGPRDH